MLIYIIRHGETDWNRAGRVQGHTDRPLNEEGVRLAIEAGKGLSHIPFDLCFSSPLIRARDTAVQILKQNPDYNTRAALTAKLLPGHFVPERHDGILMITDKRIQEVSFGEWEGLNGWHCGEDAQLPFEQFDLFFRNPSALEHFPKGGERIELVFERTNQFLCELASLSFLKDARILLSTHGAAMRALMYQFYVNKSDFWNGHIPGNCEVSILEADGCGNIRMLNEGFLPGQ